MPFAPIPSCPGWLISEAGEIRNERGLPAHYWLCPKNGYWRVRLGDRYFQLHSLVAETFLPPRPSAAHCLFRKDGDARNCCADNLIWLRRDDGMKLYRQQKQHPNHLTPQKRAQIAEDALHLPRAHVAAKHHVSISTVDKALAQHSALRANESAYR